MGAEDWSYVLQEVPGCMAFLGTRPEGAGLVAPNHSNRMVLDESAMAVGIATYAAVALRWLQEAQLPADGCREMDVLRTRPVASRPPCRWAAALP